MCNTQEENRRGRIADCLPLIQATDGLTLSQVCAMSGLEPSTIQNWIKRGYVPHPVGKKYRERHLARILLIAELRETMQIDRVGELLRYINGDTDDESDDIISEVTLYDLFCGITEGLNTEAEIDGAVEKAVQQAAISPAFHEKLACALRIMAYTHLSNIYKQRADDLFKDRHCEEL